MAKQTAVEWLINELTDDPSKFLFLCDKPEYMNELTKIIEQAKAMEKEQIIEADLHASLRTALGSDFTLSERRVKELAEQYYNETYENNK